MEPDLLAPRARVCKTGGEGIIRKSGRDGGRFLARKAARDATMTLQSVVEKLSVKPMDQRLQPSAPASFALKNCKRRGMAVLLTLLSLIASATFADEKRSITAINDVESIEIYADDWWLSVRHDGSAMLAFGASDSAPLTKGSISLARLYEQIVPHLKSRGQGDPLLASVNFRIKNGGVDGPYLLIDKETIRKTFSEARGKMDPIWKAGIESLLKSRPLPQAAQHEQPAGK